jgi:isoquinoline 1-oxidoreductase alpha subunit
VKAELRVNGEPRTIEADADTPLLWVLRDHLGMTGTKFGCGIGQCGSCTVHMNGLATRSCQVLLASAIGTSITTIEGLSRNGTHALQRAWLEDNVPQCGYCQAGMLMAAAALLRQHDSPTDEQINSSITNICRCGTYPRVRAAIHKAAAKMRAAQGSPDPQSPRDPQRPRPPS